MVFLHGPRRVDGVRGAHREEVRQGRDQRRAREPVPARARGVGHRVSHRRLDRREARASRATRRSGSRRACCTRSRPAPRTATCTCPTTSWSRRRRSCSASTPSSCRRGSARSRRASSSSARCSAIAARARRCRSCTTRRSSRRALLAELAATPARTFPLDIGAAIHAFESVTGLELATQQRRRSRPRCATGAW